MAPEYDSTTRTILKNPKNIMVEAKLRVLLVHRCCTGRHCEAGEPGSYRELAHDSTSRKLPNNPTNIIFEAKLSKLSVDRYGTSRHCETGRPVATEAHNWYIGTGI